MLVGSAGVGRDDDLLFAVVVDQGIDFLGPPGQAAPAYGWRAVVEVIVGQLADDARVPQLNFGVPCGIGPPNDAAATDLRFIDLVRVGNGDGLRIALGPHHDLGGSPGVTLPDVRGPAKMRSKVQVGSRSQLKHLPGRLSRAGGCRREKGYAKPGSHD